MKEELEMESMMIDLCKDLSKEEKEKCEVIDLDLDDVTLHLLKQLAERTKKPLDVLLEEALVSFVNTLQNDPTLEV